MNAYRLNTDPVKVVITGATGFLGGYVLRELAMRHNIESIPVTRQEVNGWCRISDYAQTPIGDVLIHLAENNDRAAVATAGQTYVTEKLNTLVSLLAKPYRRVVYASSSVLYRDDDARALLPSDPTLSGDFYTHLKRLSELNVLESPGGIVVRLANIYGPGMSANNVMSTILQQIPGEGSLEVMDKHPVRDFIWVEDAAKGIVTLALNPLDNFDRRRVFNLGSGLGTSIEKVANMALKIAGQSGRSVGTKLSSGRKSCLILDISATTSACGWQPTTSLGQGLIKMLKEKTVETP
jgi:UDP-glucose 4-epimerase